MNIEHSYEYMLYDSKESSTHLMTTLHLCDQTPIMTLASKPIIPARRTMLEIDTTYLMMIVPASGKSRLCHFSYGYL